MRRMIKAVEQQAPFVFS